MDGRRTLKFLRLDEVMPEVVRLMAGHRTLANWSLGQICNHLTDTFRFSIEGFPVRAPWLVRKLVGPVARRLVLSRGKMPDGIKLPEKFAPQPGLDARAEAEALRAAISFFGAHTGPHSQHPFFGRMTAEDWRRLHCIHCAHHLGFVVPDPASRG